ncbi:ABC transporter permease [Sedimenticola sp.]|uniref:ABC transporter permease n=1 Tax=Sedimenticola sp. TaxID=1940285 RepID=UPI003D09D8B8
MVKLLSKAQPAQASQALGEEGSVAVASQWQLMWWKFRKNHMAIIGLVVAILYYLLAIFAEFGAPKSVDFYDAEYVYAPPQQIQFFNEGRFEPFVYGLKYERDPLSLRQLWEVDEETRIPLGIFVKGEPYKLLGVFSSDIHLFGTVEPDAPFFLLGADRNGRDLLSRIIFSARISLTVGLVGVFASLVIGVLVGGVSGLFGGLIDVVIQRLIEIVNSVPNLPLMMAFAAIVPPGTPAVQVYLLVTLILAMFSWTGMARVVRGRFLALREEDFILAARLDGVRTRRLITRHMLPSFLSHIVASITIAIPYMILSETGLSFLGLGLRPPTVSWGVLLRDANRISVLKDFPWLLWPAPAVIIFVVAMNFVGNGLRDAADPYAT